MKPLVRTSWLPWDPYRFDHVGGGKRCGRGDTVEGYCDTRWLLGLLCTQSKVENVVLHGTGVVLVETIPLGN